MVLQGEDSKKPWVAAEGLAWLGSGKEDETSGDVLTLKVKLRDPQRRGELNVGRFLVATGSVRPLHLDGASALGRAPWGSSLELFGGVPVVPRFGERAYDWAVGGRVAQALADRATLGFAYVQRRDRGSIADEEVGVDVAAIPVRSVDIAARGAWDLVSEGLADALVSVGTRVSDVRLEGFFSRRSPSRILPATSLFSVLGDLPSTRAGGTIRWYAAPRLDLLGSIAGQAQEDHAGYDGSLRVTLRTDDEGKGSLGLELRRQGLPGTAWSGARGLATVPLVHYLRASTEVEIAVPDQPRGRGSAWPWALIALSWRHPKGVEIAAALEAAARPNVSHEVVGLARLSYAWGR